MISAFDKDCEYKKVLAIFPGKYELGVYPLPRENSAEVIKDTCPLGLVPLNTVF